jgi:hypothetical protein
VVDYISFFDPRKSLIWDLLDFPLNPRRVDLGTSSCGFSLGDGRNDSLGRCGLLGNGSGGSSGDIAVGLLCYLLGSR